MPRKIDLVLSGVQTLHEDMRAVNARIDTVHQRIDTLIDSLSDLRQDFDRHEHND